MGRLEPRGLRPDHSAPGDEFPGALLQLAFRSAARFAPSYSPEPDVRPGVRSNSPNATEAASPNLAPESLRMLRRFVGLRPERLPKPPNSTLPRSKVQLPAHRTALRPASNDISANFGPDVVRKGAQVAPAATTDLFHTALCLRWKRRWPRLGRRNGNSVRLQARMLRNFGGLRPERLPELPKRNAIAQQGAASCASNRYPARGRRKGNLLRTQAPALSAGGRQLWLGF